MPRLAAAHGVPLIVMHNRAEPRYTTSWRRSSPTCVAAIERAVAAGVPPGDAHRRPRLRLREDAPTTTSRCCATWGRCESSAGRSCSGTSRKSTLGRILDLPADERLEATLATTALGIAAGRRHRPRPRRRAPTSAPPASATPSSAGTWRDGSRAGRRPALSDRIVLANMQFEAPPRRTTTGSRRRPSRSRSTSSSRATCSRAGVDDDLDRDRRLRPRLRRSSGRSSSRRSFQLLEALAEAISHELLADFDVDEVVVRVRKPNVRLGGPLDYAGVEIWRRRPDRQARGGPTGVAKR